MLTREHLRSHLNRLTGKARAVLDVVDDPSATVVSFIVIPWNAPNGITKFSASSMVLGTPTEAGFGAGGIGIGFGAGVAAGAAAAMGADTGAAFASSFTGTGSDTGAGVGTGTGAGAGFAAGFLPRLGAAGAGSAFC